MKKCFMVIFTLLLMTLCVSCRGENKIETLTYAVFPYLPDVGYYEELIEKQWVKIEPDIKLVKAEWDCYKDAAPEGIDVIMYDSIKRNDIIEAGWIQPIEKNAVHDIQDIYSFALDAFVGDDAIIAIKAYSQLNDRRSDFQDERDNNNKHRSIINRHERISRFSF